METYRVAVIGHTGRGNYGHGLDKVWLDVPACKIVAVADPVEAGRQQALKRLQIYGSQGVLEILTGHLPSVQFLDDPAWSPGRSNRKWQPVSSAGLGEPEPLTDGGLHAGNVLACRDLIAAIQEDRLPEANIYEARTTVAMIAAVFESQRIGGPVTFPLTNRENPLSLLKVT